MVGGGPSGSILARIACTLGHRVTLLEAEEHPRAAIGESSTPLAALSLERLAARYDLPDLYSLASWQRSRESFPRHRRGLKRGFTFFKHQKSQGFRCSAANESRLLVAASPNEGVADSHWWRAQVDQHLFQKAAEAGVEALQGARVEGVDLSDGGVEVRFNQGGRRHRLKGSLLVDASGEGALLPRQLGLERRSMETHSGLVGGHFRGVPTFAEVAPESSQLGDPYPADRAAVHHIVEEGWLYALRYDDGFVSAGLLVEGGLNARTERQAWDLFRKITNSYPSLQASFGEARREGRTWWTPRLQRCWSQASGSRWVLMPHTFAFVDPLYSTGLAWTFLGVERLASILEKEGVESPAIVDGSAFEPYAQLLALEAAHGDRLMASAYGTFSRFEEFTSQAMIYFAAASFAEARGRLCSGDRECWEGFLGATDPILRDILEEVRQGPLKGNSRTLELIANRLQSRNLAGLAMGHKRNLYAVEADDLVKASHLLGLSAETVEKALPRLWGEEQ